MCEREGTRAMISGVRRVVGKVRCVKCVEVCNGAVRTGLRLNLAGVWIRGTTCDNLQVCKSSR